jgi:hypothetical protein
MSDEMNNEIDTESNIDEAHGQERIGFRVGDDYYVEFADGEFIHEDENGNLFADTLVYKIVNDEKNLINNEEITPELHSEIEVAISAFLESAIRSFLDVNEKLDTTISEDGFEEIIVDE